MLFYYFFLINFKLYYKQSVKPVARMFYLLSCLCPSFILSVRFNGALERHSQKNDNFINVITRVQSRMCLYHLDKFCCYCLYFMM